MKQVIHNIILKFAISVISRRGAMSGVYMYLSSRDSRHLFPTNRLNDFIVEFDQEIQLLNCQSSRLSQKLSVALTEISICPTGSFRTRTGLPESCVVLCDICDLTYIKGTRLPILRVLTSPLEEISGSLFQPYYIETNAVSFKRLHFQIIARDLIPLNAAKWNFESEVRCTVHFAIL